MIQTSDKPTFTTSKPVSSYVAGQVARMMPSNADIHIFTDEKGRNRIMAGPSRQEDVKRLLKLLTA